MITLACIGLYLLIGWRIAMRIYLLVEEQDRQFVRKQQEKYPTLHPTQADRERDEREYLAKMAFLAYGWAIMGGLLWPVVVLGLVLKHFFDVSISSTQREKELHR